MKTRKFLGDVDDPQLYADMLENVFLLQYEELGEILGKFPIVRVLQQPDWSSLVSDEMSSTHLELTRMRHTMSLLVRDMAERKRRLANRAVGLPDVELDEERT